MVTVISSGHQIDGSVPRCVCEAEAADELCGGASRGAPDGAWRIPLLTSPKAKRFRSKPTLNEQEGSALESCAQGSGALSSWV